MLKETRHIVTGKNDEPNNDIKWRMYPIDGKQNYPFCTLKLSILKLKQPTNKY